MRTAKTVKQCVATYSSIALHSLVPKIEDFVVRANGDHCRLNVTNACKAAMDCEWRGS